MNEEKEVIQVNVPIPLLKSIREANSDYKQIPAKDVVHIALNHFLDELKRRRKA
jgi:hypothetical protein